MRLLTVASLLITHALALGAGFAAGIYTLPILTAPPPPNAQQLDGVSSKAVYSGHFRRDLTGSDALHWGEGEVSVAPDAIALKGRLAPGPDYRLYLSPTFVENEAEFAQHKAQMRQVGDVKTFQDFVVALPPGVDVAQYRAVIVWCESFGEFITAARYR